MSDYWMMLTLPPVGAATACAADPARLLVPESGLSTAELATAIPGFRYLCRRSDGAALVKVTRANFPASGARELKCAVHATAPVAATAVHRRDFVLPAARDFGHGRGFFGVHPQQQGFAMGDRWGPDFPGVVPPPPAPAPAPAPAPPPPPAHVFTPSTTRAFTPSCGDHTCEVCDRA
jgi:hypothetical protein